MFQMLRRPFCGQPQTPTQRVIAEHKVGPQIPRALQPALLLPLGTCSCVGHIEHWVATRLVFPRNNQSPCMWFLHVQIPLAKDGKYQENSPAFS